MLSDKLSVLRTKHKLSQTELAKRLGIARTTLSGYESGNRDPDYETLKKIADYFEVSTDYLLDHEIDKKDDLEFYKSKIATEFPYIDLMFKDLESFSAEDMKEVYEYIKFKKSQKDI